MPYTAMNEDATIEMAWVADTKKRLREAQDQLHATRKKAEAEALVSLKEQHEKERAAYPGCETYYQWLKAAVRRAMTQLAPSEIVWVQVQKDSASIKLFGGMPRTQYIPAVRLEDNMVRRNEVMLWNRGNGDMPSNIRMRLTDHLRFWAETIELEASVENTGWRLEQQDIPFTRCALVCHTTVFPFGLEHGDSVLGIRVPLDDKGK